MSEHCRRKFNEPKYCEISSSLILSSESLLCGGGTLILSKFKRENFFKQKEIFKIHTQHILTKHPSEKGRNEIRPQFPQCFKEEHEKQRQRDRCKEQHKADKLMNQEESPQSLYSS